MAFQLSFPFTFKQAACAPLKLPAVLKGIFTDCEKKLRESKPFKSRLLQFACAGIAVAVGLGGPGYLAGVFLLNAIAAPAFSTIIAAVVMVPLTSCMGALMGGGGVGMMRSPMRLRKIEALKEAEEKQRQLDLEKLRQIQRDLDTVRTGTTSEIKIAPRLQFKSRRKPDHPPSAATPPAPQKI